MILQIGSTATHSQSVCARQRSRVRSSSNWIVRHLEIVKDAVVERGAVLGGARQGGGDGGGKIAKVAHGRGKRQPSASALSSMATR
jgi:hypothetical protein